MESLDIDGELRRCRSLPHGRSRTQRLETLAAAARSGTDRALEGNVLLELARSYMYAGERDLSPMAYGRLLSIYDAHPAELGHLSYSVHWQLKWMTWDLIGNPAVPLPTVHRWLDEMDNRYRQRGYSARPVLSLRADLACAIGDHDNAIALRDAALTEQRDQMADCDACERNGWGVISAAAGDDEAALEQWRPVIDGERSCAEEPHRTLAKALVPMLRTGRTAAARSAHLTGYPLVRHNIELRASVGEHIEFCALTGNEARGLEILAEHSGWITEQAADIGSRLSFITGVSVLLRRLVARDMADLPVGGGTVASVLALLEAEIEEVVRRYDTRNGTGEYRKRVDERQTRQPLVELLPLGLRARSLATRSVSTATASGVTGKASEVIPAAAGATTDSVSPTSSSDVAAASSGAAAGSSGAAATRSLSTTTSSGAAAAPGVGATGSSVAAGSGAPVAGRAAAAPVPPDTGTVVAGTGVYGATASATAEPVDDAAVDRSAEATRLIEAATARLNTDPAAAETQLRRALALGSGVLTREDLARLNSLLVSALAGQPGREADLADAALYAAARWSGLSEADAAHHSCVAARAFHRAGQHGPAAALFDQVVGDPDLGYPASELAVIGAQYGASLSALGRPDEAARQYVSAAKLIEHQPGHDELRAELAEAAAEALARAGRNSDGRAAYLRAAQLWGGLGRIGARAECLRRVAWMQTWDADADSESPAWLATIDALIEELSAGLDQAPPPESAAELAAELETAREQRTQMRAEFIGGDDDR
ncbi:hypothetical protein [Nocardia cyriacigeorgica]|uniref:hypothetical protein n=1 Tax=Nocardia cyriacigeorgica TaxID=135487 RepID=UPI0003188F34|nr:hypothetical protein [Nocardia cyriacigeorgica]AVH24747.1 hypothetical protein C5B73_28570 [Nocardia cyriacigeorgica]MBF6495973.1 hypothetical protein [Nocardia cyriacigeorgica]PPJ04458.1 hypothetical protein C5E43_23410 [Nocardia cyriacigeorgica]TLF53580.1 hypothetical protein FEK31_26480 [Nocardia cyriacigeorgica]